LLLVDASSASPSAESAAASGWRGLALPTAESGFEEWMLRDDWHATWRRVVLGRLAWRLAAWGRHTRRCSGTAVCTVGHRACRSILGKARKLYANAIRRRLPFAYMRNTGTSLRCMAAMYCRRSPLTGNACSQSGRIRLNTSNVCDALRTQDCRGRMFMQLSNPATPIVTGRIARSLNTLQFTDPPDGPDQPTLSAPRTIKETLARELNAVRLSNCQVMQQRAVPPAAYDACHLTPQPSDPLVATTLCTATALLSSANMTTPAWGAGGGWADQVDEAEAKGAVLGGDDFPTLGAAASKKDPKEKKKKPVKMPLGAFMTSAGAASRMSDQEIRQSLPSRPLGREDGEGGGGGMGGAFKDYDNQRRGELLPCWSGGLTSRSAAEPNSHVLL
jgi:hypothetical protein